MLIFFKEACLVTFNLPNFFIWLLIISIENIQSNNQSLKKKICLKSEYSLSRWIGRKEVTSLSISGKHIDNLIRLLLDHLL